MKNLPTLAGDGGGKPEKIKQKRGLKLFCSLGSSGFSRSTTFLYWSRYKPYYWENCIDGEKSYCWLFWIVFVVGGSESLKMLDCQCRLSDIFFLRIAFLQN